MHRFAIEITSDGDSIIVSVDPRSATVSDQESERCFEVVLSALKKAKISPNSFGSDTSGIDSRFRGVRHRRWARMKFAVDEITADQAVTVVKAALKAEGVPTQVK